MPPEQVQSLLGRPASLLVARGASRKPGTTPFRKSAASWKMEFHDEARLEQMVLTLIEVLGGVEHLVEVKNSVNPEFFEIDLSMWIKNSEEQEGGVFEPATIHMLSQLGARLSFGFYDR